MTSDELNEALFEISTRDDIFITGLGTSGKNIPYIGWYWRNVGFDLPISLGILPGEWVGFIENNKWGYDEFDLTSAQSAKVRALCESLAAYPSNKTAQALNDYVQSLYKETD